MTEYTKSMKRLLKTQKYNQGLRPSGSLVTDKWGRDHGGAIPSNLLSYSNTKGASKFRQKMRDLGLKQHPAIFPEELPEFFIKLCSEENDIVLDPFAGSNTTGWISEKLNRKWLSLELNEDFAKSSEYRFKD